jgi:tetratricopeptide (TPR) repeat protein
MKHLIFGLFLGAAAILRAEDMDIPLAVTGLAHPSLLTTPTAGELRKSDEYLKSGLAFLKKNMPQRAVDEFNDSVHLAPRAENYKALGTAYYQAGNSAKASWAYRQSLQLKPDTQVQALIDSLEGKDHPEENFRDKNDEIRYARLLKSAAAAEKQGKRDSAMRDYLDAYQLKREPEARRPVGRLGARLIEDYLKARSTSKAIEVLIKVRHTYENAKDLDAAEIQELARVEKAETEVVRLTGEKLRQHEVDMQSDRERWERHLAELEASRGGTKVIVNH